MFSAILTAVLFGAACTQNLENDENKPKTPELMPETTEETVEFKLEDLLHEFGLEKGEVTASDAAKKIRDGMHASTAITFTEKKIISYDDKTGTFTVKVAGKKDNKNFSNKITAQEFIHPYASAPTLKNTGDKIILDEALEQNLTLQEFINSLNNPSKLANYLQLKFTLENGKTIAVSDAGKSYKLTASFTATSDGKIKVTPKYELVYKKSTDGSTEETIKEQMTTTGAAFRNIEYDYFTENDVFAYVAEQIKDDIIKVPGDRFASEFYAFAKYANSIPIDIFNVDNGSKFKKYQETYAKSNGHIKITQSSGTSDLSYGIDNPKNGGITADDYSGTIKVNYYVQRYGFIADKTAGSHTGTSAVKPITVEKNGFMKVSEDFLKQNFLFNLTNSGNKEAAKDKWLKRFFNNIELLGKKTPEGYELKNKDIIAFKNGATDAYYLSINNGTSLANLAVQSKQYLSVANGRGKEYRLLITSIRMKKVINQKDLTLTFSFEGTGNPIELTLRPFPWD